MSRIVRFSVSLEPELLEQLDRYVAQHQFATRSEAVRQLIHEILAREAWQSGTHEVAGTLTLVFDHHRAQIRDRLAQLQHDNTDLIVSVLHVHLTHELCLEVVVLRGPASRLQKIASQLRGMKGVHKGELVVASPTET